MAPSLVSFPVAHVNGENTHCQRILPIASQNNRQPDNDRSLEKK